MPCVYLTTNKVNNRKYIGVDSNDNPKYLGSGVIIKLAIKKYGKENFIKEIIESNENIEYIFEREKYYVTKYNAINSKDFYNLSDGGKGGNTLNNPDTYIKWKKNAPNIVEFNIKNLKNKTYDEIYGEERATVEKEKRSVSLIGHEVLKETREKISRSNKGKEPWNKGLTVDDPRVLKNVHNRKPKITIKKYKLITPENDIYLFDGRKNIENFIKKINIDKNSHKKIQVDKLIKEKFNKGYTVEIV